MKIIIFVLVIIILILSTYLFLLLKEIKDIKESIDYIKKIDTNHLVSSKYNLKCTKEIIIEINNLIKKSKNIEIEYNHKNESLKKMMMNISHDLRTPLTSALGYIDILLKSDLSEEEKNKELKIIESRLKKLESLINSFFEFSKIISNNKKPEINSINLNKILEESIVNYYEDYKQVNRKIILHCKEQRIIINSNELLLKRIFDNLIGNAYKHSHSNLEIKVTVSKNIKIEFKNILEDVDLELDKMFDEFYTVDISRTRGSTGLGLAIAKEFTEQLNGKISASKNKNYLKITIEIPKNR